MDKEDTGTSEDANSNHGPDGSIHACKEKGTSKGEASTEESSPRLQDMRQSFSQAFLWTYIAPHHLLASPKDCITASCVNGALDTCSVPLPQILSFLRPFLARAIWGIIIMNVYWGVRHC